MPRLRCAALLVALALVASDAAAHKPPRVTARELVRLAGSFASAASGGEAGAPSMLVTVQGRERAFRTSDWRVFALVSEEARDAPVPAPARLTLQGPRELLARLASARAEQRVAVLGERRPGGGEVFVLALDLCPAE
jgi:hypothetical protein